MKTISLTRRLIATVVISQLALVMALVVVASAYCFHHLESAFDVSLEGHALHMASLVHYNVDHGAHLDFDGTNIPPAHHVIHKDIYLIKSDRGGLTLHAGDENSHLFDSIPANGHFWNFTQDGEPYRAIILRDLQLYSPDNDSSRASVRITVVYASPTMDIAQRISEMTEWIVLASLLLFSPSCLLSVWSIRRTLVPLNSLANDAKLISAEYWSFTPSPGARSSKELQPLILVIETVLAGLQRSFQRQRDFLGDAAHELKTSIAILKSGFQTLLNQPRSADEYRQGLINLSEDGDRLEQLLHRMLLLARAEQWAADGSDRKLEFIDLASTCEMSIARIRKIADELGISIQLVQYEPVMLRADSADLELVWLNLLENSVKASSYGSSVTMEILPETDVVIVRVIDEGTGIAPADLELIFDRFRRGDPSRSRTTGGFGLGLAIVKSIVEAYKGSIRVESELGQGTSMTVTLLRGAALTSHELTRKSRSHLPQDQGMGHPPELECHR